MFEIPDLVVAKEIGMVEGDNVRQESVVFLPVFIGKFAVPLRWRGR